MDFEKLAVTRYSVRKISSQPIEEEKLRLVLKAAQAAPTAHNLQPQHIFVLKSPEALEKVNQCTPCHFGEPVVLVVAYDPEKSWKRTEYDGKNHGEVDAAITAAHLMLQAADLGLGTTYVGVFDPKLLLEKFPEMQGYTPIGLLPIGYPAENSHPSKLHGDRHPLEEFYSEL
jgi:nitroreductase